MSTITNHNNQKLFAPTKNGQASLLSRIIISPLTRRRRILQETPSELKANYYVKKTQRLLSEIDI